MEPLMTLNEIASVLRVSRASIYRWIAQGDFPPPIVVGCHKRWKQQDLENYFEQRRADPADYVEPVHTHWLGGNYATTTRRS